MKGRIRRHLTGGRHCTVIGESSGTIPLGGDLLMLSPLRKGMKVNEDNPMEQLEISCIFGGFNG
jgi:hypothetical protein